MLSPRLAQIELSLIRQVMNQAPPDAINMALGELSYPYPDFLREEIQALIKTHNPAYTPNAGMLKAREAITSQYDRLDPSRVCITNGAEEAAFIIMFATIDRGDIVAIPDPDYAAYPSIAKMLGADVLRLPFAEGMQSIDFELWESLLCPKVKLLILSNPQNPSGYLYSEKELKSIATICSNRGICLIVDEIYHELYFEHRPVSIHSIWDQAFVINGLSKSHLQSGMRLGWIISPEQFCEGIVKAKQYISTCSNWLAQALVEVALGDKGQDFVQSLRIRLSAAQNAAWHAFQEAGIATLESKPLATPYLMFRTPFDDLEFCQSISTHGVIIVPGRAFGTVSKGWARLNFAIPEKNLQLGLQVIADYCQKHSLINRILTEA